MHEWTHDAMHKAPPPMPDKERLSGCSFTIVGFSIALGVGLAILYKQWVTVM